MAFGHIPLVLLDHLVAIEYLNDLIPPLWLFFSPVSFLGWDGVCGWLCSNFLLFWCAFAFQFLLLLSGVRRQYYVCSGRRTRCDQGLVHPNPPFG